MRTSSRRRVPSTTNRRFQLGVEGLEDRTVPSDAGGVFHVPENTSVIVSAQATHIVQTTDGEVTLPSTAGSEFSGSTLPAGWQATPWSTGAAGGTATVGGGV